MGRRYLCLRVRLSHWKSVVCIPLISDDLAGELIGQPLEFRYPLFLPIRQIPVPCSRSEDAEFNGYCTQF
jgi:hypothetical protein